MPYIGNPIYQSAFVTDTFSGNGSTTAFTMSVAPAGTTNVLVVVSGVVQDPSTYGVSGNTLTFSAAPPSGTNNISCRYLGIPASGVTTTAYRTKTEFTATAGQTTFTPPSYTVGYIDVFRNGVLLGSADYTASNGTTVVLASGATSGDLITTESFYVSSVLNAIPNVPASVGTSNIQSSVTLTTPTIDKINNTAGQSLGAGNASIMKNRIINGAMVIDQRNAGASVTPTASGYTLDRWQAVLINVSKFSVQQNAGSVTAPVGFTNYLGVTSLAATSLAAGDYYNLYQPIEGYNVADLGFGTANAKTVTLSFWVRSSLTGTFGGSLANNLTDRSYPFTYTISSANTWTQISITIPGCTTGTWETTNSIGLKVFFGLGVGTTYSGTAGAWANAAYLSATGATSVVGTNGATFYITGVQLEVGSSATGFEYRQYTTELQLCQRYCPVLVIDATSANNNRLLGYAQTSTIVDYPWQFPVTTRVAATGITVNGTFTFGVASTNAGTTSSVSFNNSGTSNASIRTTTTVGSPTLAQGSLAYLSGNTGSATIIFNGCEL